MRKNDFTHWKAHKFRTNKVKAISFDDLERLCQVFKCTPNDLFEWIPNKHEDEHNNNPLQKLKKDTSITNIIDGLSYDQMKEIAKAIKENKKI